MKYFSFIRLFLTFLFILYFYLESFAIDRAIQNLIAQKAEQSTDKIISIRRHIHMYPELSNREYRTSEFIAQTLEQLGLEVKRGVAKTGVVGLLRGEKSGLTVGIRADMDALPIQEVNDIPYSSKNPGVMHACGHDVHMAVALGTAEVLSEMRDKLKGNVKFIFQPAEEGAPDGEEGGASLMIKEGVLENPEVSAIFGLHIFPDLKVGTIGYNLATTMASVDKFEVIIKGKRSHGAYPWESIDPVVTASQIILGWQTIISRQIDIRNPAVLTVGIFEIYGEPGRFNIIPEQVRLIGTVRSLSDETRKQVEEKMRKISQNIAKANDAEITLFKYVRSTPVVVNNPELVQKTLPTIKEVVGSENVISVIPSMGGEDFEFFMEKIPGFFFRLGIRNEEKGITPSALHTADLMVDEDAIIIGVKVMANILVDYLEREGD